MEILIFLFYLKIFSQDLRNFFLINLIKSIKFLYYIHTYQNVLFISDKYFLILIFSDFINNQFILSKNINHPITFLTLSESISLGE
jgi:hypothetical protein